MCFTSQASYLKCPEYRANCKVRCTLWECIHAVPCSLTTASPDMSGVIHQDILLDFSLPHTNLVRTGRLVCQSCIGGALGDVTPTVLVAALLLPVAFFAAVSQLQTGSGNSTHTRTRELYSQLAADKRGDSRFSEVSSSDSFTGQWQDRPSNPSFLNVDQSYTSIPMRSMGDAPYASSQNRDLGGPVEARDSALSDLQSESSFHSGFQSLPERDSAVKEDRTEREREAFIPLIVPRFTQADLPGKQVQPSKRKAQQDKFPLGLARFCASLHVVCGHLFARGLIEEHYFFGSGFTWVPWFFMLSGFVLFSAEIRQSRGESSCEYMLRRSVTIYPLYGMSLLPAFALAKMHGKAPPNNVLFLQTWLLQERYPCLCSVVECCNLHPQGSRNTPIFHQT